MKEWKKGDGCKSERRQVGYHELLDNRPEVSFKRSTKERKLILVEMKRMKEMEVLITVVDG